MLRAKFRAIKQNKFTAGAGRTHAGAGCRCHAAKADSNVIMIATPPKSMDYDALIDWQNAMRFIFDTDGPDRQNAASQKDA